MMPAQSILLILIKKISLVYNEKIYGGVIENTSKSNNGLLMESYEPLKEVEKTLKLFKKF